MAAAGLAVFVPGLRDAAAEDLGVVGFRRNDLGRRVISFQAARDAEDRTPGSGIRKTK